MPGIFCAQSAISTHCTLFVTPYYRRTAVKFAVGHIFNLSCFTQCPTRKVLGENTVALRLRICRIWPTENLTFYCFALGKLFASAQFWNICSSLEVANSHFSVLSHSTVILSNFRSLFYDPIYTPRRVRNIAALHLLFSSLFILRQLIMTGLHYDKSVKIVFFL